MLNDPSLNFSNIPKELNLLIEILKSKNNKESLSFRRELFRDINWDTFLRLAKHHRVYPLAYIKLKELDQRLVPLRVIQTLYQEYKINTFQMLQLSGEIEQVSKLFSENQIRTLFLKGPVLAKDIYNDVSLRTSKDIDILISIDDLEKTHRLLLEYGYEPEETGQGKKVIRRWGKHHVAYSSPKKGIQIEVHWRLHPPPTKEPSFNELWRRKRQSNLTAYPVYFLGKKDLLLYLIDHGNRHGWFRLRWLTDIDLVIRNLVISKQNSKVFDARKGYHLDQEANFLRIQALILANQLLETPIDEEAKLIIEEKHSKRLIRLAITSIVQMGDPSSKQSEIAFESYTHRLHLIKSDLKRALLINWYLFLMKPNIHKIIFLGDLLKPYLLGNKGVQLLQQTLPSLNFLLLWKKKKSKKAHK
ncbi:Renal dipeptidase [Priestia megaterium]|uniref:nucleotidyltransferase domain-containing protein n=1 Tax=Priestia megaterium TaxID=1404 RepID=UPI000BFBF576|nr:nucleotidyltransferase family protein [Priestia megaterium]PGK22464.1 Renal dipeptidase [Priestia megaterium]